MKLEATAPQTEDGPSATGFVFSSDLFVVTDPTSARSEAVRGMRTHLLAQHVEEGRRGLAICAAGADVGTMKLAANLAASFAQVGVSCLLVDADLRNPTLSQIIKAPENVPSLADYLSENVGADQIVQHDVLPNLSIIYGGGPRPDAQELLGAESFSRLGKNWLRDYDITIVNTPPANRYADGRRISAVIGYSIVAARRNVSYVSDLKHLVSQLRGDGVRIVGTTLSYE